ncbi:uncharacterized protein BX664DRAFT_135062 [Halteromyces radiatus]|uniref:uncharacterized protein n=1 Tax=Halteromyces radiatus TaxID=101107 RepID=UPI00221F5B76|nr:uncharacterized protein BX664DRAFT_135062 [Halteromyces radiatus]KAI8089482.1 hypothetical protein BX664DRAFT_135062 [Halteromyces radiatus]
MKSVNHATITQKFTLPPLIKDDTQQFSPILAKPAILVPRGSNTPSLTHPPAFLEPQPQTTMDQQHDAIRHPRPHRLSLSSLSSLSSISSSSSSSSSYSSFEEDQTGNDSDSSMSPHPQQQQQQQQRHYRNILPLPVMGTNSGMNDTYENTSKYTDHRQLPYISTLPTESSSLHVTNALGSNNNSSQQHNHRHHRQNFHLGSPSCSSTTCNIDNNKPIGLRDLDSTGSSSASSPSNSSLSPIEVMTPSSPVPSSLLTFWASPTSVNNEQQHEFVTKNAHIKRPRNAWIHFRCYFGQSLKAKDPTIRAEEISKRASEYWSRLTSKQKKPWHILAEQEKLAHQEAFPNYRYRPKRALPKSVVLNYTTSSTTSTGVLDQCSKKFRLV